MGLKAPSFTAALIIAPGSFDISNCFNRFDRPYELMLLHSAKSHFVNKNETILREFNSMAVDEILASNTLQEFSERSTIFSGFETSDKLFKYGNTVTKVHEIITPYCVINAKDDPFFENSFDINSNYLPHKGNRNDHQVVLDSPFGMLVLPNSGSHLPFLDGTFFPIGRDPLKFSEGGSGILLASWCDESAMEWFTFWLNENVRTDE